MSKLQSPSRSFFKEIGLLLNAESSALKGRNMLPMVCRSVYRTLQKVGSCAKEMKSFKNMSTYFRTFSVVGSNGSCVPGRATAVLELVGGADAAAPGNFTAAASSSRR